MRSLLIVLASAILAAALREASPPGAPCWALMTFAVAAFIGPEP